MAPKKREIREPSRKSERIIDKKNKPPQVKPTTSESATTRAPKKSTRRGKKVKRAAVGANGKLALRERKLYQDEPTWLTGTVLRSIIRPTHKIRAGAVEKVQFLMGKHTDDIIQQALSRMITEDRVTLLGSDVIESTR